ncbi:MAG TPA: DNA-binding domain-containing protein [Burkholderiaceae bacterium]
MLNEQLALQAAIVDAGAATGLLRAGSRLDVYVNAYRARLIAALRGNFEVLYRAMGDEAFDALALDYLAAHPSTHPSIRWFGHRLVAHMEGYDDLPHPALIDFARLDWALREAFDGPDSRPMAADVLAALPAAAWPGLRLQLGPTVQRVALAYAIGPAWHALREAASTDELPEMDEPAEHAHEVLVWRQGLETRWRSLVPQEAALLAAVAQGDAFGTLCERAANLMGEEDVTAAVVAALQQWLADEILMQSS